MKRIRHFLTALLVHWADDAAGRGAAKVLVGVLLIVAGVFSALGEVSGLAVGALVGGLLLYIGSQLEPPDYEDELIVKGEVADFVELQRARSGPRFRPIYAYEVNGKRYTQPASIRTIRPPAKGSPVRIACSASNPQEAHRDDGLEGYLHLAAYGVGALTIVISLVGLLMSLALILAGALLIRAGQADRSEIESSLGLFADAKRLFYSVSERVVQVRQRAIKQADPPRSED
ncbi:DUF3592 domain-containing protein [Halorhodospira halochloris]|uniref:DUF3592 domain-containing protein n=1 Tax=Halorhodospira halochloris TaxID=1052 RepID=UPI001EE9ACE6|nr:hypothetical protein [Halorhodospira halochloris]MCG5547919.1 hypothetical protein [Halorhodospira halochloris]